MWTLCNSKCGIKLSNLSSPLLKIEVPRSPLNTMGGHEVPSSSISSSWEPSRSHNSSLMKGRMMGWTYLFYSNHWWYFVQITTMAGFYENAAVASYRKNPIFMTRSSGQRLEQRRLKREEDFIVRRNGFSEWHLYSEWRLNGNSRQFLQHPKKIDPNR